jgi:GntR family transcriptional repressor for pyruvate dehydrogenase complex
MLKPVRKSRVSDEATSQLIGLILSGGYAVGDKLPPERELAGQLSITRTSLREALRQMENMGLLRVRPGDGIYVEDHRTNATLDFVRHLLSAGLGLDRPLIMAIEEVRRIFAVKMVELAAERIDEESLGRLQEIVDCFPRTATEELLSGEWDFRLFHEIAKATGNSLFVYMLNTIRDVFSQLRWIYSRLDEGFESVAELNEKIVAALRAGDKDLAVSLVETRMRSDSEMLDRLLNHADAKPNETNLQKALTTTQGGG